MPTEKRKLRVVEQHDAYTHFAQLATESALCAKYLACPVQC